MQNTTKRNLIEERKEREQQVIALFKQAYIQNGEPLSFEEFVAQNKKVEEIYTGHSLRALFDRLIKYGVIKVAHVADKPTPVIFPYQRFYHPDVIPDKSARSWLTAEEKTHMKEEFQASIQEEWEQINQGIVIYLGCHEIKEENHQFLSNLAKVVYHKLNRPITSQELAQLLIGEKEELFDTVIEAIRLAKTLKYLKSVSPKDKVMDKTLFVPHDMETVPLENRDWYYNHEARRVFMEQVKKDIQEKKETEGNEQKVYQSLLNKGRLDVYLFMKIHRVMSIPKVFLLDVKISDYDEKNRTLNIPIGVDILTIHLDENTCNLIQEWLHLRSFMPTSDSPYFFITPTQGQIDKVNTLASIFRKEANAHHYVLSLVYRDSTKSFLRGRRFWIRESSMVAEMKDTKLDWFKSLETIFLKQYKR